ncbi:MAG: hypothetical protein P8Y29_09455 [Gemmatimonadota bacterium]
MSRHYSWLRRTVDLWAAQKIHSHIEAVLVRPVALTDEPIRTNDFELFHSLKIVDVPELDSVGTGFAAGVRRAQAPIVMLAEDHAFPEPGLAEAILAAYDDPYAPNTREARMLGGHNASYRREFLVSLGDDLRELYMSERVLQFEIEARGLKMILLARPRIGHFNFSRWRSTIVHAFQGGRLFAGQRCRGWRFGRRVVYAAGAPLVPFIRLRRIVSDLRESPEEYARLVPSRLPIFALVLSLHALGEAFGYGFGIGTAVERYAPFELYRRDQLITREREQIEAYEFS